MVLLKEKRAKCQRIQVGGKICIYGLTGCADDGLATYIERGVEEHWNPGDVIKGRDQIVLIPALEIYFNKSIIETTDFICLS